MYRIAFALLALAALPAFAPAPFPRSGRPMASSSEVSLDTLQGTWRITSVRRTRTNGQHVKQEWTTDGFRVEKDRWVYLSKGNVTVTYSVVIDPGKRPTTIDWYTEGNKQGDSKGKGIVRRVGKRIEIAYYFGTMPRATSFEAMPDDLWYVTLER